MFTSKNVQLEDERATWAFPFHLPVHLSHVHCLPESTSRLPVIELVPTDRSLRVTATLRSSAFLLACSAKYNDYFSFRLQKNVKL